MEYIATDIELASIADAIRAKSGSSNSLQFPEGFVSEIESIHTGNGFDGMDVVFYDSLADDGNGEIVFACSAADFLAMTEMPDNPNHSNYTTHGIHIPMTPQGWNWTLEDAKAYVAKYGKLNIGQMYIPTDGKSHYICFVPTDAPTERWNMEINITVNNGNVRWQVDNGANNTANGTISAIFPSAGWHDVKISAPSGVSYYPHVPSSASNETRGKIQKIIGVYIGEGVTKFGANAFQNCHSLTSVTIPRGISSMETDVFQNCHSLKSIVVPSTVTTIGSFAFSSCYSAVFISIPNGLSSIGNGLLYYCYSLTSLTIPDGVASIGSDAFSYCHSLVSVIIPDSVTSIGSNAFSSCYSLTSVSIPDGITVIESGVFQNCLSLTAIHIPNGVTSIGGYAFYYCCSVASIVIPNGVTTIGNYAFYYWNSLTSVVLPASVSSIGNNVFRNCYSLKNIMIERAAPPVLSNNNTFGYLMNDYSIIVPDGSLSTYTSATNWSSVASHIVEAS